MKTKTCTAELKALDDTGQFEAIVSVFGNVDLGGDRVVKGAFAKSLQQWEASGDPIPVIWSHQWDNPAAHIGEVLEAEERDEGLYVKGQLDIDDDPFAAKVHKLLGKRRVKEFSFAYDVNDEAWADGANELREIGLIEVGPTLKGMNPDTALLGVKAAPAREAGGTKARVSLAGSVEERQGNITSAVIGWAREMLGPDLFSAYVEATFTDELVAYTETWDEPYEGGTYWQMSYEVGDDGTVELGDPVEVEIAGTIVPTPPKSRGKEARRIASSDAGRIQALHDLAADLGAGCSTQTSSDEDDEAKSRANPDAGDGKGEEPATRSPDPAVVLAATSVDLIETDE